MPSLQESLSTLPRVRKQDAEKLQRLNIHSIMDVLFHLPLRYLDHTRLHSIDSLQAGQYACIQGVISDSRVHYPGRRSLHCLLQDDSGCIGLRFFHFNRRQQRQLGAGCLVRCFGTVRQGPQGHLEMVHPQYRVFTGQPPALEQNLLAVYPGTRGVSQTTLRRLSGQALALLQEAEPDTIELLPDALRRDQSSSLSEALHYVHKPPPNADLTALKNGQSPAQKRLAYEELLTHKLSLRYLRQQLHKRRAPRLRNRPERMQQLLARLPFTLTPGQQQASAEIRRDLEQSVPMMRLLQGDVGSGKTAVAMLAALQALDNGWQVAMLAPTEILAEQQQQRLEALFASLALPVVYLSSRVGRAGRRQLLARLAEPQPLLAVGTHALFQEAVHFARLGLVIIDEQHRFGVRQRTRLLEKGSSLSHFPHQLVMTATPIPRTLTMTAYADLDCSVIPELPPGRQQVTTVAVSHRRRDALIERLARACASGRQAYWVCTLIEESESLPYQTAIDTQQELQAKLRGRSIGLLHGKMPASEKEQKMRQFRDGDHDVLVATTVIEVGVDVPNASLMVIDNAERLGLAQLHQLRGRVGRDSRHSDCVLLYQAPLSPLAQQRLDTLRKTHSGFEIAEQDLRLRGPGELLGHRQTGLPELRIADLLRDRDLLGQVDRGCRHILEHHPECVEPLIQRWLGQPQDYSNL